MTKREKILAIAVGGLVTVIGAFYLINSVTTAFADRNNRVLTLKNAIEKQKSTIALGNQAQLELQGLLEKSLPSDKSFAQTTYHDWLVNLADTKVGFDRVTVAPQMKRPHADLYTEYPFAITGTGNLEQLVEFLYHFYHADYLHRISSISMLPMTGSNQLNLTIRVQSLSLNAAPARRPLDNPPVSRLARDDMDDYIEVIAQRNPFAPANKPPQYASVETQRQSVGRPISFIAKATDPDEGDILTHEILGEALPGARINAETGLFRWTPREKGDYEVMLRATDSRGLASDLKVQLVVGEAQPVAAAPVFDAATLAEVTGITESGSERELWVTVHTEGRVLILREGDPIEVGTVEGVVAQIQESLARIEMKNGQVLEVGLGKHLVEQASGG